MMFHDVTWCSMMFHFLRAFLVSSRRSVPSEFLQSFLILLFSYLSHLRSFVSLFHLCTLICQTCTFFSLSLNIVHFLCHKTVLFEFIFTFIQYSSFSKFLFYIFYFCLSFGFLSENLLDFSKLFHILDFGFLPTYSLPSENTL